MLAHCVLNEQKQTSPRNVFSNYLKVGRTTCWKTLTYSSAAYGVYD